MDLLLNKIACTTFAIALFFFGAFSILCGALLVYSAFSGVAPVEVTDLEKMLGMTLPDRLLGALGAAFFIFGAIFVGIGVFALMRHLWAMIVGAVLAVLMAYDCSPTGEPDHVAIGAAVFFVALAIVALITGWRLRAAKGAAAASTA